MKIHGEVQGVFFRHSAREKARELGVGGFARNEHDGTVYIEAEGEKEGLEAFLAWCRTGPSSARVERVEHEWGEGALGFRDFEIR